MAAEASLPPVYFPSVGSGMGKQIQTVAIQLERNTSALHSCIESGNGQLAGRCFQMIRKDYSILKAVNDDFEMFSDPCAPRLSRYYEARIFELTALAETILRSSTRLFDIECDTIRFSPAAVELSGHYKRVGKELLDKVRAEEMASNIILEDFAAEYRARFIASCPVATPIMSPDRPPTLDEIAEVVDVLLNGEVPIRTERREEIFAGDSDDDEAFGYTFWDCCRGFWNRFIGV